MIWRYLIEGPWIVFAVYWVAGALKTRRTVSQESLASRSGFLFLEILGFVLLFSSLAGIGVLGHRVFHRTYTLAVAGAALTWIGIAIALWARWQGCFELGVFLGAATPRTVMSPAFAFRLPGCRQPRRG
jgi:hypothetical protein